MPKKYSPKTIFKQGSTTYYYSSLFFPNKLRDRITILYAFVRMVDDLVDSTPQKKREFFELKELFYTKARKDKTTDVRVIDEYRELEKTYDFKLEWMDAFWYAMELDLSKKSYRNMHELVVYMHGSAEVIGLMLSKLMNLPVESYGYAQKLGRSMQYINFLRDIAEDTELQRTYIPQNILAKYKLTDVLQQTARAHPSRFIRLMRSQVEQYYSWQQEAKKGFRYLPFRARIAIQTASDLYNWTAKEVDKDPFIVFEKKLKPSKLRIACYGITNAVRSLIII